MTYYGGKELATSFRTVRANTIKIAEEIPESQYGFQSSPDVRTVGKLLVHIALAARFQLTTHQNKVSDLATVNFQEFMATNAAEEAKPRGKAETIAFLKSEGERFAAYMEGLTESFLAEPVKMMPGSEPAAKSRFEMLLSAKEHEMHHRGQLMLIQRMIGLVPHLTRQFQERMAAHAGR